MNDLKLQSRHAVLYACLIILLLRGQAALGQDKRPLTPGDYAQWGYLSNNGLSPGGKWVCYSLLYENGRDTLFVRDNKGMVTYTFPGGQRGGFSGDKWFCAIDSDKKLHLLDLDNGRADTFEDVQKYQFISGGKYLLAQQSGNDSKRLFIKSLATSTTRYIDDVAEYAYNTATGVTAVACPRNGQQLVMLVTAEGNDRIVFTLGNGAKINRLVWQENGQSLALLAEMNGDQPVLTWYSIGNRKSYRFDPGKFPDYPADAQIVLSSYAPLRISEDGTGIFFGIKKKPAVAIDPKVEEWNIDDKYIYPEKVEVSDWENIPKIALWRPREDRFRLITDKAFPHMLLTGNQDYALVYDPAANEPQANREAPLDIYLLELATGRKGLILEGQPGASGFTSASPGGRYISYFRKGHWRVYDLKKKQHRNLTATLPVPFSDPEYDWPDESPYIDFPIWTDGDKEVLLTDKYDIWLVPADGGPAKRLTNGLASKTKYRAMPENKQAPRQNYTGTIQGKIGKGESMLVRIEGPEENGIAVYKDGNIRTLLTGAKYISSLKLSGSVVSFIEEDFDRPPALSVLEGSSPRILLESNPQHHSFKWGSAVRITYTVAGRPLSGVLCLPYGYGSHKAYPMIVHVYEKQSGSLHRYIHPTLHNYTGFNVTHLLAQGYMVLLPDITYTVGSPGRSALECTLAAVNEVTRKYAVDRDRIGIIGHSFGGFETNYIIAHTSLFAAAVSGAGISDYNTGYLSVAEGFGKPNFWHYEFGQLRMNGPLFEDRQAYYENSPVFNARHIVTPLLLWAGKEDTQVNSDQSIRMYMALRRCGKEGKMLLYPKEGHALFDPENQVDLTRRVDAWFAYYLKNVPIK